MLTRRTNQSGVSLVELMVGIAIALILLTGVLTVTFRVTMSGADSVRAARLNQQIRSTMDFLSKDLQRAGYVDWYDLWDDDNGDLNPVDSNDDTTPDTASTLLDLNDDDKEDVLDYYEAVTPGIALFGDIRMMSFPTAGTASNGAAACTTNCDCVLFSYDLNGDGRQGVGGASGAGAGQNAVNFELFGFRWNDGAIEQRTSITNAGDWNNCNSAPANGWQDITDSNVTITNLAMSLVFGTTTAFDSTVYVIDPDGSPAPTLATACTPAVAGEYPAGGDTLCLWRRKIDITLQGRLTDDAAVDVQLTNSVKIKNDYLDTTP